MNLNLSHSEAGGEPSLGLLTAVPSSQRCSSIVKNFASTNNNKRDDSPAWMLLMAEPRCLVVGLQDESHRDLRSSSRVRLSESNRGGPSPDKQRLQALGMGPWRLTRAFPALPHTRLYSWGNFSSAVASLLAPTLGSCL